MILSQKIGKRGLIIAIAVFSGLLMVWFLSLIFPLRKEVLAPVVNPAEEQIIRDTEPAALPPARNDFGLPGQVLHEVAFTPQAPFAQWDDVRFQNACEEAAVLMAWSWAQNDPKLTPDEATEAILDMVAFQQSRYGFFIDSSARDTARFFREYYGYGGVSVSEEVTVERIKSELGRGNLVLVPADGRVLGNPNFTEPGPVRHMLAVIGYDEERGLFITNDPGTRNGRGYEYDYEVLVNAVRDYPSGDHAPILADEKVMIVVSPGS